MVSLKDKEKGLKEKVHDAAVQVDYTN